MHDILSEKLPEAMEGTLLLDFYSPTCTPCKALLPVLTNLRETFAGRVSFAKFNVESDDYKTASSFQVRSVPTLILFHQGKILGRRSGTATPTELQNWIEELLPS